MRDPRSVRALLVALVLGTSLLTVVACEPTLSTETGLVVDVQSTSLTSIDGFRLHTADGRTLSFSTVGTRYEDDGFPIQHLREHLALAEPVMVTYRVVDGANQVVKLQDAPASR